MGRKFDIDRMGMEYIQSSMAPLSELTSTNRRRCGKMEHLDEFDEDRHSCQSCWASRRRQCQKNKDEISEQSGEMFKEDEDT